MAKPAFIYAFDNLGPYRFVELCGELLGARYKGFILGGVGPDGGIDAEIDSVLGEWHPETSDALSGQIIESDQTVVFQFKHRVTARTGQSRVRQELLNQYKGEASEVNKELVTKKKPDVYVLITNVEVNSQFRDSFQDVCQTANPNIKHYQVIGLDELEIWVTQAMNLRHLYFPTIFDLPRYNLKLDIDVGFVGDPPEQDMNLIVIVVQNIGTLTSYLSSIMIRAFDGDEERYYLYKGRDFLDDPIMRALNPRYGDPLVPGRRQSVCFSAEEWKNDFKDKFLVEIVATDEIGNRYVLPITDDIRKRVFED